MVIWFYFPSTPKVIWRQVHGFKSHTKDWRSLGSNSGAQFEGDLGEILALGAEISPYVGLMEKWGSP